MPLPSFFKPKDKKPAPRGRAAAQPTAGDAGGPVQEARTRARRRLIGAVVLLAIGLIGFPLLFETQPRPVALDIPIEAPPSSTAGGKAAAAKPVPPRASAPVVVAAAPAEVIEEPPPPKTTPAPAPTPMASTPPPKAAPPPAAAKPEPAKAEAKPEAKPDDSARAKALLEDAAPKAGAGRFVVQVGAYTDADKLRDARQRVEKLGLKTYTQVVETDAGKRTRVRVGPFATRDEADGAGAKLKAAGLPAAVLAL